MNQPKFNPEETNKAAVRRLYEEGFNQGKLDVLDQLIAPEFPGLISPGPAAGSGPEGFKASARQLTAGFPDVHFTLHEVLAEHDRVTVRWTWEGTHRGPFAGLPPTGRPARQEGMVMYRFEEGKVAEGRALFDRLGLLQQLGAFPAAAGQPHAGKGEK